MLPQSLRQDQAPTAEQSREKGEHPAVAGPCPSPPLPRAPQALRLDRSRDVDGRRRSQRAPRTVPPPRQRFPVWCAFNRSRGTLRWATAQTTRSSCNWISLWVAFWLSVWKQNSVAKHYFFFMSLLLRLLCQGGGINFGHFIKKSPFGFPSCSLKSSKANNETIGTEERNKVLGFLLVTKFISLLFQLAPILATRQTSGYILWKQMLAMLWLHHSAVQQGALKVCSTFACISEVQIRNRRICTQSWFHVQHPHFYKYAHPCTCSSVHLVNLSKLQSMPGKGHLQTTSDSVIFVIISPSRFCCEVLGGFFFFTWEVLNNCSFINVITWGGGGGRNLEEKNVEKGNFPIALKQ